MEVSSYKYDVFLSYIARDVDTVESFANQLRRYGFRVLMDRDLAPGTEWPEKLRNALNESGSVVVFIGPSGWGPGQIDAIVLLAKSTNVRVIPVLLPGGTSDKLPESLANRMLVDFGGGLDPETFEVLVQGIQGRTVSPPAQGQSRPPAVPSQSVDRSHLAEFAPRARNAMLRADTFRRSKKNTRIHMEHLVMGLVDEEDEPVRQLFARARIDRHDLIAILRKAPVNIPADQPYEPSKATSLPRLSNHVEEALQAAGRFASTVGVANIDTTYLLQGVFSVQDCKVVVALVQAGVRPELPTAGEDEGPPLIEVSIRVASAGDQPVEKDALGFEPYVQAVAEFLVNEETRPPLTLSIEGEWGSGKSSFMLQLEKELKSREEPFRSWAVSRLKRLVKSWGPDREGRWSRLQRELVAPCCLTVRFNAWRHDKEDALWAAFASEFLRRISRERAWPRRWLGHFRLFWNRYRLRDGWLEMLRAIAVWVVWSVLLFLLGLAVPVAALRSWPAWSGKIESQLREQGKESAKNSQEKKIPEGTASNPKGSKESKADPWPPVFAWLVGFGGLGAYTAGLISLALKIKGVIGNPLEVNLRKYINSPDYDGRVAFVEAFHEDFRRIVNAYAGGRKVYVFIDDLDRCEVPKAADLMQAINLLIADDPRLLFIIGMDREKVAAGLAVKYEKLLPYLMPESVDERGKIDARAGLEYGYTFIEKFIQLPFRVPSPKPANLLDFLDSLAGRSVSPAFSAAATPREKMIGAAEGAARSAEPSGKLPVPSDLKTQDSDSAQKQARREQFRLVLRDDSETLRHTALMVAPALENNPRRLKQFVNLFRLRTYIACETGAFDEVGGRALTLPQLGKLVAISLMWPGLLTDLAENPGLLPLLHRVAIKETEPDWSPSLIESRWIHHPGLLYLLRYGCVEELGTDVVPDPKAYRLAEIDLDGLLRVSPKVLRPRTSPATGRPEVPKKRRTQNLLEIFGEFSKSQLSERPQRRSKARS